MRNQIDKEDFVIFYATICHVCKRFGDGVRLKRCGGCKMIAYCDQQHQKQHWAQHKSLCKAIQNVLRVYRIENRGVTLEEWRNIKMNFMLLVLLKLGRRLKLYEKQMFMLSRECAVCYERNGQLLEDCQKCAASYCKSHKDSIAHRDTCASLELCFRLDLLTMEENFHLPDQYLRHTSDADTCQDMNDFIKFIYRNIQTHSEKIFDDTLAAIDSIFLTRPLTIFHAMQLLNYVPKRKDLVIHVVAADVAEESTFKIWDILLYLIKTITSLLVIMIGPKLHKVNLSDFSNNCMLLEKKFSLEFHDVLYENYARSPSFIKPDLIVGFNTGIHEHELVSTIETWASSIQMLAKQNCPFITTCYTQQEGEKDIDRINFILNRNVDYLYSGKNPFASLRPSRSFDLMERVFYDNHYLIVYKSLCP